MDALTRRLLAHPDNKTKQAMQHDCERAAEELGALLKDAERYRKLRDRPEADVRIVGVGKRSGAALDAAADAMPAVGAA